MAKVTSKLQVTMPKALAERYHIEPGDEIKWEAAGDVIRVVPPRAKPAGDLATRLKIFDQATARQRIREHAKPLTVATDRGWTREELYDRGRPR
ncbi:MAG TPA: AbrB/MazE/SpoVT family DNA-binding domain-containing protein [Anaeromyxobacteraceae bacterium]|nr:AbrB/MazE/SpoVT family DNA-binding domain-containing protein [Anaeromyxobacteraceae bacterium]